MTAAVLLWVEVAFVLALLFGGWRLLRGPGLPDRILALDTLYVNAIALLVLFGIQHDTQLLFEAALVVALLGFIGTVALSKYVTRGDIIESTE
jgi:multicomponent K+:H+ antiporter subunit F